MLDQICEETRHVAPMSLSKLGDLMETPPKFDQVPSSPLPFFGEIPLFLIPIAQENIWKSVVLDKRW